MSNNPPPGIPPLVPPPGLAAALGGPPIPMQIGPGQAIASTGTVKPTVNSTFAPPASTTLRTRTLIGETRAALGQVINAINHAEATVPGKLDELLKANSPADLKKLENFNVEDARAFLAALLVAIGPIRVPAPASATSPPV